VWKVHSLLQDSLRYLARTDNIILPNGTHASTTEEALGYLSDTHLPGNAAWLVTKHRAMVHQVSKEDWEIAQEIVTEECLKWVISLFAPFKSQGLDGIFPAILQNGLDILLPRLVLLFKACTSTEACTVPMAYISSSSSTEAWAYRLHSG